MTSKPIFFLFFLLLVISLPNAYAVTTATVQMFGSGEAGFDDDQIVLDNDSTVDLSYAVETVPETIESIGGQNVTLSKEVLIGASGDTVNLINTQLPTVEVQIPNGTTISAPANWNQQLAPPKAVSTTNIEISGFITPTRAIQVGSPDVVLVFDKAVTIVLENTIGQTAYKIPGGTEWILISTCNGTFENPNNPRPNGECSISNEVDTKIVTFHFTEFAGLSATPTPTPTPSPGNSGGHGNTGVGSPRAFGGSSGGGGGGAYYGPVGETKQTIFPTWFDNVTGWYREGKISPMEFLNAYQWIVENIMK